MNGDSLELMRAIGEMKAELLQDIGEVKAQNATQLESITNLRRELLDDGGRVTNIEDRLYEIEFWQNVKTVIVVPLVLAIHKVLTVTGWKI